MQIIKVERVEFSQNEAEALRLVRTMADRLEDEVDSPILRSIAADLGEAIDNLYEYV